MTDAGYAVFAIDWLGHGGSQRLTPQVLTLEVHAEVAHELIGKLRAGEVGGETGPQSRAGLQPDQADHHPDVPGARQQGAAVLRHRPEPVHQ
jgi:hypothetical protein